MGNITMRELATALGVSTATISMVLNGKPGISDETREKVFAAVVASGYDTEKLGSSPRKKKGGITLVIYKKHGRVVGDTPFFATLTESIERQANAEGYLLNIRYVSDKPDMAGLGGDGVLLLGTELENEDVAGFKRNGRPLVVLDNDLSLLPVNTISIDNAGGINMAAKHLISKGHRDIGYLKSAASIQNFSERYSAYLGALSENVLRAGDVIPLESSMDGAYRDMSQWLERDKIKSTAFLADNDFIALGAIRALREKGHRLGDDISVVGFDDLPFTRINEPPLTTIRVYNDELGAAAVDRIVELIRKPDQPFRHMRIGTELKERGSVREL